MSKTTTVSTQFLSAGTNVRNTATISTDLSGSWNDTLQSAEGGSLSTRTSDTQGVITIDDSAGHSVATGEVCDVYWTGGKRRGVTVSVSGSDATISGGNGDNLPVQGTDIAIAEVKVVDLNFDPSNLKAFACNLDQAGQLVFLNSLGVELEAYTLVADQGWVWFDGNGYTNPLLDLTDSSSDDDYVGSVRISTSYEGTSTVTGDLAWAYDASTT